MWDIYVMEYYLVIKKHETFKVKEATKKIILREVTQTQKGK